MSKRPNKEASHAQKELDKCEATFEAFNQNVKDLTMDRMNEAPREESEPQTKLSQKEIERSKDIYLKPKRTIHPSPNPKTGAAEKFNEKFREAYEFDKQYVYFIAENKEIGGENITLWTRPYGGLPAEEWEVPVNKPVWGPRYLAEQIKRKSYHRLVMQQNPTHSEGAGTFYGQMVADTSIQRLDAIPVSQRKSVFMGASGF